MRKFFLGAALVAASFGMAQSADAATVMDVDGVSTVLAISDYEGTYNGTMDQIKMRGEDYEPRAASYTLENGILSCDFPQIGSMPGNITIELEVEVDEETGEITAFKGDKAGTLTILGMDLVTLKLDSLTDHTLCGIHAGKGNEQETIMDYKTSKLYKQNEKVILFIQPSYGNSNRIKFV